MRLKSLFFLAILPLLASSQQKNSNAASPSVQLSTSFSVGVTLGPNRQIISTTIPVVFTITPTPTSTPSATGSAAGNATVSGNSTISGNSTMTKSGNSSSTTTNSNLPTAATDLPIGGMGTNGAPNPGATQGGGIYGPGDGYISAARALRRNALVVGSVGILVGGGLVLL